MEKDLFARLSDCCILTPHLLELSRLSKLSLEKIRSERVSLCLDFSRETGAVLVCKDAASLTAGEGRVYINQTGNAGMATAGSGDVLTGVIAGCVLALQNGEGERDLPLAAALGVCLHGAAGDLASGEKSKRGMSASDLIPALSAVLKELEEGGRGALCLENPVLDLEMEEKE